MNYRRPDLRDRLAAEYALGTLHGRARARLLQLLRDDPRLQSRVAFWEQQLAPMALALRAGAPSAKVWRAIMARVAPVTPVTPVTSAARAAPVAPWWARWFEVRSLGSLAAGLMLGLTLTLVGPTRHERAAGDGGDGPQLPQSYIGVLAAADGRTGVIVSSLRHGTVMDVKQVQPVPMASGRTLYLWAIDAAGATRPIGAVPQGKFVQVPLARTAEALFSSAVELALSIEAELAAPLQPSGPFVYRGLCGKLWRVPAPIGAPITAPTTAPKR
jgi:anti-sigma-K factor RskA